MLRSGGLELEWYTPPCSDKADCMREREEALNVAKLVTSRVRGLRGPALGAVYHNGNVNADVHVAN